MEYKELVKTGIKISEITFGAWAIGGWMWGGADEGDALKAMEKAFDLGITTIDTAPVYGFGKSESLVGKIIKGRRNQFQVLTKYGLKWNTHEGVFYFDSQDEKGNKVSIHRFAGKKSIMDECEASLKRLGTDYIDLYQIHWPDPSTPVGESMEAINQLIKQGKILAAGVSNYSLDQMKEANSFIEICTNQVPYSMVKRDIEKDLVPYCVESGKGILAYSPLQRGILTGKIHPGYRFNEGDHRPATLYYKEPNLSRINHFLEQIKPIAHIYNATLSQLVLNWTTRQPGILSTLAGARNPEQVAENAKAAGLVIEEIHLQLINKKLQELTLDMSV